MQKLFAWSVLPLMVFSVAACNDSDKASKSSAEGAAVTSSTDESMTDLGLDASTADAMSVDVAAGGIEPVIDPAAALPPATDTSVAAAPPPLQ